jgi:hypothetical protein
MGDLTLLGLIRSWLLTKIAGKMLVVLNCSFGIVDRETPNNCFFHIPKEGGVIRNIEFEDSIASRRTLLITESGKRG